MTMKIKCQPICNMYVIYIYEHLNKFKGWIMSLYSRGYRCAATSQFSHRQNDGRELSIDIDERKRWKARCPNLAKAIKEDNYSWDKILFNKVYLRFNFYHVCVKRKEGLVILAGSRQANTHWQIKLFDTG